MEQSNIILVVNDSTLGFDHSSPLVTEASGGDGVFDRDRQPVQRAPRSPVGSRLVCGRRPLACDIDRQCADRVDLRIEPGDAGQLGVEEFHGSELSGADRRRLLGRRPQCWVSRGHRRSVATRVLAIVGP